MFGYRLDGFWLVRGGLCLDSGISFRGDKNREGSFFEVVEGI